MSFRKEQCKKICRILDDVLANRPTERDSLIVAVQLAFESLSEQRWIPCSERLPEEGKYVVAVSKHIGIDYNFYKYEFGRILRNPNTNDLYWDFGHFVSIGEEMERIVAWMSLPEVYKDDEVTE